MIWLISFILLILLIILAITVAAVMSNLGLIIGWLFTSSPIYRAVGEVSWSSTSSFVLFAIPLFILLGQILVKAKVAEKTYKAVDKWLSWLPGGLMHSNILTSALFAATSGSSVATAATIGTVALPQAKKYGYNDGLFSASIAAGGTLGILIPPSINLVIYGFLTNTSIVKLFLAGIVPGVLLAVLFMIFILIISIIRPELSGDKSLVSWKERIVVVKDLFPLGFVFIVVIGSIYLGFATPTEAAALGVIAALIIAAYHKELNFKVLIESFEGTIRTTGMIMFIILAASFLNYVLISLGIGNQITNILNNLNLTPFETLLIIIFLYVIMGFFIETLSIMVLTIPIVHPIIVSIGYDSIWFGIILILLIEMALVTPPVGLNLYVVQGVRRRGSIGEISLWIAPFVIMIFIMIAILILFPNLVFLLIK